MAIAITNLTKGGATGSITSQATASISPSPNNLVLLSVTSRTNASVEPNAPTATGNGLTWVQVNTIYFDTTSTSRKKLTLFRAMGSSPSAEAITIDFAGQTQTDVIWVVDQVSGINLSGTNGSGSIVQSATNNVAGTFSTGTFTVTLGSFSVANNGTYGVFTCDNILNGTASAGTGFTQIVNDQTFPSGGNLQTYFTEWKATNDTTVDVSLPGDGATSVGGIAVEIVSSRNLVTNINTNGGINLRPRVFGPGIAR